MRADETGLRAPEASPDRGKLIGLIGLSRRAGKLAMGYEAVADRIRTGKAQLVLMACNLSEKTEKELRYAAREHPAELRRVPLEKEAIGHALGLQKAVGVLAVEDSGLAAAMRKHCPPEAEPDTR